MDPADIAYEEILMDSEYELHVETWPDGCPDGCSTCERRFADGVLAADGERR